eukprot:1062953-Amphidinium_carterae.1
MQEGICHYAHLGIAPFALTRETNATTAKFCKSTFRKQPNTNQDGAKNRHPKGAKTHTRTTQKLTLQQHNNRQRGAKQTPRRHNNRYTETAQKTDSKTAR